MPKKISVQTAYQVLLKNTVKVIYKFLPSKVGKINHTNGIIVIIAVIFGVTIPRI
ncbi:MAG: hypothetical protein ABH896_04595 [Candidatus Jacksonbacteria bacterium]